MAADRKLKIYREGSRESEISMTHWKDLISALVLNGYEVYGDDDYIMFSMGCEDEVIEG